MQVLLVTGGRGSGDTLHLDSTELLLPTADHWATISSAALPGGSEGLPQRWGLKGATLNNIVVVTGTNIKVDVTQITIHYI